LTDVYNSGGIGGRAGGSYTYKGQFDNTAINFLSSSSSDVFMRSRNEDTNEIYPLVWYTKNKTDDDGLVPTHSYKHFVATFKK
jgi:hypothetical protein